MQDVEDEPLFTERPAWTSPSPGSKSPSGCPATPAPAA